MQICQTNNQATLFFIVFQNTFTAVFMQNRPWNSLILMEIANFAVKIN